MKPWFNFQRLARVARAVWAFLKPGHADRLAELERKVDLLRRGNHNF